MSSSESCEDHVLVNHWLRGVGGQAGLVLHLDDEGLCAVGHASGLNCAIEVPAGSGLVYLRVPLMPFAGLPSSLPEQCLADNFLGVGSTRASYALDRNEGEIVLWVSRSLSNLDQSRFGRLIVQLFDTAIECKSALEDFCRAEATSGNPHPELDASFMSRA